MAKPFIQRRSRSPLVVIERDFNEALDRLLAGKPQKPALRKLAAEGRLLINPSTVAEEAGRSRTLIGLEECRLPDVRNRILTASRGGDIVAPRTVADVIMRLRENVVDLRRERDRLMVENLKLRTAWTEMSKEAAKWRNAHKRGMAHDAEDAKVSSIRGRK